MLSLRLMKPTAALVVRGFRLLFAPLAPRRACGLYCRSTTAARLLAVQARPGADNTSYTQRLASFLSFSKRKVKPCSRSGCRRPPARGQHQPRSSGKGKRRGGAREVAGANSFCPTRARACPGPGQQQGRRPAATCRPASSPWAAGRHFGENCLTRRLNALFST